MIPVWRLREIRNIADSMVYRAACCPVGRLAIVAERGYLKPTAHIRLFIDPKLKVGGAYHYIQVLKNATYADDPTSKANLIEVTICFNGDLTTRGKWTKTMRGILREIGDIIFFSDAAKRPVVDQHHETLIDKFVKWVLKNHPFRVDTTNRPRLMLAHLQEIVRHDLYEQTREVLPHMQRLLMPYLGPDGWW